jgi:hypothetical protein
MSWTIIYHYHNQPIHLSHIKYSNPNCQVISTKLIHNLDQKIAWKNSDRILRQNIKTFIDNIIYDNILLVEWDVMINAPIPDLDFDGLLSKKILTDKNNGWCWWNEYHALPDNYKPFICGSPLWSLIGIKKQCLIKILDPIYDDLYNMNIFCEIRTATLFKSLGYSMAEFPKNVSEFILDSSAASEQLVSDEIKKQKHCGIFHPVKHSLEISS